MSTLTITSSSFGTIGAIVQGDVPATITVDVGVPGPAGVGVPAGGSTGMVLKKVSGTDYDTAWQTDLNSGVWGQISGTLTNQLDLVAALALKADLASPALSGVPTAPTAPTLTSTTQLATTAFVQQELAAGTAVAKNLEVAVRNQTGSTLAAGTIVYINGATGNLPTVTKALATGDSTSAQTLGFIKASIANNGTGFVIVRGTLENIDTSALTEGQQLYLSGTTAGTWTTTKPVAPVHLVYVGIVVRSHPNLGKIEVAVMNGFEIGELHDVVITTPSNGQVLKYDGATGLWKNQTDASGVAWGGITGTLTAQVDLSNALAAKYDASNPAGYITSSALSPYLLSSTAASTYLSLSGGTVTGDIHLQGAGVDMKVRGFNPTSSTYRAVLTQNSFTINSDDQTVPVGLYAFATQSGSNYEGSFQLIDNTGNFRSCRVVIDNFELPRFELTGTTAGSANDIKIQDGKFLTPNATITEPYLRADGNLSNLSDASVARTNLGLGTMATQSASAYAALSGAAFTGNVTASANSISARRIIGQPNAGTAGVNIGTGGTDAASTTPGDIWIATGGASLNFRDGQGSWRQCLTTSSAGIIDINSASTALRVTQRGAGEAFRVEDSTTPDATAFVIDASGKVGVGVSADTAAAINVDANGIRWNTGGGAIQQLSAPVVASGTYDREIALTINGVNYRIPCRQV